MGPLIWGTSQCSQPAGLVLAGPGIQEWQGGKPTSMQAEATVSGEGFGVQEGEGGHASHRRAQQCERVSMRMGTLSKRDELAPFLVAPLASNRWITRWSSTCMVHTQPCAPRSPMRPGILIILLYSGLGDAWPASMSTKWQVPQTVCRPLTLLAPGSRPAPFCAWPSPECPPPRCRLLQNGRCSPRPAARCDAPGSWPATHEYPGRVLTHCKERGAGVALLQHRGTGPDLHGWHSPAPPPERRPVLTYHGHQRGGLVAAARDKGRGRREKPVLLQMVVQLGSDSRSWGSQCGQARKP